MSQFGHAQAIPTVQAMQPPQHLTTPSNTTTPSAAAAQRNPNGSETATKPSAPAAKNHESDSSEEVAGGFAPSKDRSGTDATGSQTQSSGSRNQSAGDSAQGSSTSADSTDDAPPQRDGDTSAAKGAAASLQQQECGPPTTQLQQESLGTPETGSNLFVAGLPPTVDDAVLAAAFSAHGRVVSAKVMLHVDTAVSRGFGFVLFPTAAEAEHARAAMQDAAIHRHGGQLQITVSKHRGENVTAESRVVYVRHVPNSLVGSAVLSEFLAEFGPVAKLVSRSGEQRKPQPGGEELCNIIVTFGSVEAARECVAACHGKTPLPQCKVPLLSKMEEPQTLREQRLREQRMLQNQPAAEVPVADASMLVATVKLPQLQHHAEARTPSGSSVASTSGSAGHPRNSATHSRSNRTTVLQHRPHRAQQYQIPSAGPDTNPNTNTNMSAPNTALAPPLMPPFGFPGMYGMMPPMPPHAFGPLPPPPFGPYMPPMQPPMQPTPTPGPDTRTSQQHQQQHHHQHHHQQQNTPQMPSYGAAGLLPFPPGAMAYGQGMPPYLPPTFHAPYQPPH